MHGSQYHSDTETSGQRDQPAVFASDTLLGGADIAGANDG